MAQLNTNNAVVWDAAERNPNHIAALGNSKEAQHWVDGPKQRTSQMSYIAQANIRMNHALELNAAASYMVSGKTQVEFLAADKIAAVIATDVKFVIIGDPINDIGAGGWVTGYDQFNLVVKPVCELFIAAGITPIIKTCPGQNSFSGDANRRRDYQAYNQAVRSYRLLRTNGQVRVLDSAYAFLDPTSTTIALRTPTDGTHGVIPQAIREGRLLAAELLTDVPIPPVRRGYGGETAALGLQLFKNPGFLTATGAVAPGSGVTYAPGNLPLGYVNTVCDANITCTLTRNLLEDGQYEMQYDMVGTGAASGSCRTSLALDTTFPASSQEVWVRAQATVQVTSGVFRGAYLDVDSNYGAQSLWSDCWCDTSLVLGGAVSQGFQLGDITETFNYLIKVTTGSGGVVSFTPRFYHYFVGAGAATVKWRYFVVEPKLY
jgi:hypothetical protein